MSRRQAIWRARNFDRLSKRCWNEEHFVFNPASGHTHVLNDVAFAILTMLAARPTDLDTLSREFLEQDTLQMRRLLEEQLQQMETIGLIERHD